MFRAITLAVKFRVQSIIHHCSGEQCALQYRRCCIQRRYTSKKPCPRSILDGYHARGPAFRVVIPVNFRGLLVLSHRLLRMFEGLSRRWADFLSAFSLWRVESLAKCN